ncbi:Hypothetical protein RMHFA_02407 [Roseomonas mucosa]|uniref:hypothetical protein n=1 Tax=Roseomonas TaxID=125216 RepID=UPI000C18EE00|nr:MULTISPECIES: hypothetical protein [Roseomonas]ATR20327.1 hypothetical protein CTJ15_08430 [Roseomonas sp. FDAARGOS_362]UZO97453.1 Hypothetical protein RMHFA_02407 [Roseomonas mucosa]
MARPAGHLSPLLQAGAAFALCLAVLLAVGSAARPRTLDVFDQRFYAMTAWDLVHHGVYSDGFFDKVDSSREVPPPGMFLGPGYPLLLAGMMELDPRLRENAACLVRHWSSGDVAQNCPPYRGLTLPVQMALCAGALAFLFAAARRLSGSTAIAALATGIGLGTLASYAKLITLAMTESLGLFLFAGAALLFLRLFQDRGPRGLPALLAGAALGLLVLTRPSHMVLIPVALLAVAVFAARGRLSWPALPLLALGLALPLLPWMIRNGLVLGHFALSAGYGPAVLVERLSYNDMTARQLLASFLYWLPDFGDNLATALFGRDTVWPLDWDRPGSFYDLGQQHREAALALSGGIDAHFAAIVREGILLHPFWHALTTLSLAWRGLWIGRYWGIGMVLLAPFGLAAARRAGRLTPLLLYAAPAWIMLLVHAGASVNQERYNLALMLGGAIAAAWGILSLAARRMPALRRLPGLAAG